MSNIKIIILSLVIFSIFPVQNKSAVPDSLLQKAFESAPCKGDLASHFPIPLVFAEWEDTVTKVYGRNMLAKCNEHIYRDLPPCKAERVPIPKNDFLDSIISKNSALAREIILAGLNTPPEQDQWTFINACKDLKDSAFIGPLIKIAASDPFKTDRAFAYLVLSKYSFSGKNEILRGGLFDNYATIRLLCMELLKNEGDSLYYIAAINPTYLKNPFQMFFYDNSYKILFPNEKNRKFTRKPYNEKVGILKERIGESVPYIIDLANKYNKKPYAQMILYIYGSDEEKKNALTYFTRLLIEHGKLKDSFWSDEFWIRNDLIETLTLNDEKYLREILSIIDNTISAYSKEKDQLLITLCYVFNFCKISGVPEVLKKISSIKNAHPDLYLAAAQSLAFQKSKYAFTMLLQVMNMKKMPFFELAMNHMEELTRITTPGKPEDQGILHNIGLPKEEYKYDEIIKFWENWYNENTEKLYLDDSDGIFKVRK